MKTLLSLIVAAFLVPLSAIAQSTAITYQGRLADGGAPANGSYDLRFTLHDAVSAGLQYGPALTNAPVVVTDGYFLVTLDFGPGVFNGAPRWLQIGVRTNGSVAAHTLLNPRQAVATVPYAIQSLTASNVLGNISDSQLSANIARLNGPASFAGTVTFNSGLNAPFRVVNPSLVTNLNADFLDGLNSTAFALSIHAHSAAEITSGQLGDARLSANVPLLNRGQSFSGTNIFASQVIATNASNVFSGTVAGSGSGLSNLNALSLTGIVAEAALPATLSRLASNQTFTGTSTFAPAAGAPFRVGNSVLVTNLNTDLLDGLNSTAFWNTAGNTNPGANLFLGTTDNTSLDLRANNQRALRLQPGTLAPNVIGGGAGNSISPGVSGAVIGGGGPANSVTTNFGVVAGGTGNSVSGLYAAVGGGQNNTATNSSATVPGGSGNIAGGANSLAAGQGAQALHQGALVWSDTSSLNNFTSTAPNTVIFRSTGGVGINTNSPQMSLHVAGSIQADGLKLATSPQAGAVLVSDAAGNATWQPAPVRALANSTSPNLIGGYSNNAMAVGISGATISGGGSAGASNYVGGSFGTVGGGSDNSVNAAYSTIAGGYQNCAILDYASVGGGYNNVANSFYATVAGGIQNTSGFYAAIGGGYLNNAPGTGAFVGGGTAGVALGQDSVVAGGNGNIATGLRSVVGGGLQNRASNTYSAVLGGSLNTNSGLAGSIGGGIGNAVTNSYATVPGGSGNVAGGQYSFAGGRNARALHDGAFIWSDNSSSTPLVSTATNQVQIRAAGGVFLSGTAPDALLNVQGDLRMFDNDIFFRNGTDTNHGLGWFGTGGPLKTFGGFGPDGPVLYGYAGGALGTTFGGQKTALSWNSSQQVGIGTAAPGNPLAVIGNGTVNGGVGVSAEVVGRFQNNGAGHTAVSVDSPAGQDSILYLSENSSAWWGLRQDSDDSHKFDLRFHGGGANTTMMVVTTNGAVGIGTTSPQQSLSVVGGVNIDHSAQNVGTVNNTLRFGPGTSGEAIGSRRSGPAGVINGLDFYTANTLRMSIANDGTVGIGTNDAQQALSVVGGMNIDQAGQNAGSTLVNGLRFGSFSGEGIASKRTAGINQFGLDLYTASTVRLTVDSGGNVGVGTSTPAARLDVQGTARLGTGPGLTVDSSSNVGVGTTSPAAKLDVQGSVRFGVGGTVMSRVQSGTASVGTHPGGVKVFSVAFPTAFNGTPKILLTVRGEDFDDTFVVSARAVNASNFKFNILRVDSLNGGWGQNLQVDWIAWE